MLSFQSNAGILILGDSMLDVYLGGRVSRISPEAPVPVLLYEKETVVLGGAANVAMNATRLGVSAHLISVTGDDPDATRLGSLLSEKGVAFSPIVDERRITTCKTRVVGGKHQLLRIDRENAVEISGDVESKLLRLVEELLPTVSVLVLSDYAKGMLTDRVISTSIAMAREQSVPVLVDPKRRDFSIYRHATLIKPNRSELSEATGRPCTTPEDIALAAESIISTTRASLLVTLSENGMAYFAPDAPPIYMPTQARQVFDVSGAGDTTIATVACCFAGGLPIEQTMRLANLAAGIVVSKAGTATVSLDELRSAAEEHEMHATFARGTLSSLEEAVAIREHWRREGFVVGFTNGCFDLLHPGHVTMLRVAAKTCNRLIVALNSDKSVSRLKGPTRPIQDEISRALVIGAIHCVDLVTLFEEDTPLEIITALKPDVLIKGADYRENEIVGADFVKARGGRVERVPIVEGQSTTKLLQRDGRSR